MSRFAMKTKGNETVVTRARFAKRLPGPPVGDAFAHLVGSGA